MADTDTAVPETNPQPLSEVTPSAPSSDNAEAIAAERKRAEQAEMERNLLRKRLEALEKEKSDKARKELEDKEDWKTLAEQAVARAETLEKERQDEQSAQATKVATETVYSGFDPKVVEIAKTAGISATDDSDEAQAALRTKLEAIQEKIGVTKQPTPTPNNPAPRVDTPNEPKYNSVNPGLKLVPEDRMKTIVGNNRSAGQQMKSISERLREASGMQKQDF